MNAHQTIYVITPEFGNAGQLIFRDNYQPMIKGKNILILNGSITTGSTLSKTIESVLYYGGIIRGVAAIFSRVDALLLSLYILFSRLKMSLITIPIHPTTALCARKSRRLMHLSAVMDIPHCKIHDSLSTFEDNAESTFWKFFQKNKKRISENRHLKSSVFPISS